MAIRMPSPNTTTGASAQLRQRNAGLIHGVLIALSLVFALPLLWMISTSLKPIEETMRTPPVWIPMHPLFGNYPKALPSTATNSGTFPSSSTGAIRC